MNRLIKRCLILCTLLPALARAQTPADIERAKEAFRAGAAAYAAGEFLAAIQALETAYQLTPKPAIAFSLAQAERRQYFVAHEREHLLRAIELFRRYVEQVPSGGRRADALDALSQLEPLAAAKQATPAAEQRAENNPVRRTRLLITSDAVGARLSLDGGPPRPSPLIAEVTPGKHRVSVDAQGYYPRERELLAVAGELVLAEVPLREQPSTLVVSTPDDAEVYIDGRFADQGGPHVTLQLRSGRHKIVVGQKGRRVWSRVVELERGKLHFVRVTLEQTGQRTAALALFISGGAALGGGIVLSAFAVRAEGRAQEFLGRRAGQNVSGGDLDDYHDAIEDRNRFRLASIVSLASAGGLFVTGAFLHELDYPNPRELYRPSFEPEADRDTARVSESLRVLPVLGSDGFGGVVRGRF